MSTPVNLEKEFVPYAEALELKQLGFDEPCILLCRGLDMQPVCQMDYEFKTEKNSNYNDETNYWLTVPTYSQAFRWFREKHQIVCVIDFYNDGDLWEDTMYTVTISEFEHFKSHDSFVQFEYKTYEEAELACLRKLIEIVKTKQ